MNTLNFFGVGPKIGRIALPWLAVAIVASIIFKETFVYFTHSHRLLFYCGLALILLGLVMYFMTLPKLLKGLKETKLVTSGAYYLCCNPLYTAIILFIIPGVSLLMNSWLVLTAGILAYILFKVYIENEYSEMELFFGDEYKKYRAATPEFFPFPVKKWFGTE